MPTQRRPWFWGGRVGEQYIPLTWEWIVERLESEPVYWLVTSSPMRPPSARPLWGIWLDEVVMLGTGSPNHRRDLEINSNVTVHLGSGSNVVIVEGVLEVWKGTDLHRRFADAYNAKYEWNLSAREDGEVRAIKPSKILAWTDSGGPIPGTGAPHGAGKWVF